MHNASIIRSTLGADLEHLNRSKPGTIIEGSA
jgi:hypothetical protein